MGEYISRDEAINAIKSLESNMPAKDNYAKGYDAALGRVLIAVREVPPVTDVQPVNRWISVEDRLPESRKEVLVWYRYTWGNGSTSYGFGISWWHSNAKQWRDGCLLKGVEVLYWQPLPEPPKEGDTNE